MPRLTTGVAVLLLSACGGNPYGYAPQYAPTSDEDAYYESAVEVSYEEARRDPAGLGDQLIGWFGIVKSVKDLGGGMSLVSMQMHYHQPRHLCAGELDSSCRVTVSDRSGGPFSARVTLRPEDQSGRDRVYAGSLLKIYGHATTEYDDDGGPILAADYYRHWPRNTYVTTTHSRNMRR